MTHEEMIRKLREIANSYNSSEGNLNDGYNCDLCKNRGDFQRVNEEGGCVTEYCKCQQKRAVLRKIKQSHMGNIITEYTFDKYIANEGWQKEIKEKAQAFCTDDNAGWFFIGGQVGCGKTHLCSAISRHYIFDTDKNVEYMLWVDEVKKIKVLANDAKYNEIIGKLKNVDVLYIDDFLKTKAGEEPTNADIGIAFELLNSRSQDKNKITIISSEKTLQDLLNYDEATMSRIYQLSGKYRINIDKDQRRNYRLK